MRFVVFTVFFLIQIGFIDAQSQPFDNTTDSVKTTNKATIFKKKKSPQTAALLSGLLPGAGQIYNGKIWKAPIVWAGLGAFSYLWINENNRYEDAKTAYLSYLDTDPSNNIVFNGTSNVTIIQSTKNVYRNQRDMYLLLGVVFYGLNILDAAVDAHFTNFDVSDDLSMNLNLDLKSYPQTANVPSLTMNFRLKK